MIALAWLDFAAGPAAKTPQIEFSATGIAFFGRRAGTRCDTLATEESNTEQSLHPSLMRRVLCAVSCYSVFSNVARIWRISGKSCLAAAVCAGAAVLLCALMNNGWEFRVAAPMICLQAVIIVSLFWGRVPGIVGAVSAGIIFSVWLFPPIGTPIIQNASDRVILLLFQLAGLGIVFLSPRDPSRMEFGTGSNRLLLRRLGKHRNRNSE